MKIPGSSEVTAERSASMLPMLLSIVLAILLWMAADECRTRLAEVRSQLEIAERAAARSGNGEDARLLEAAKREAGMERSFLKERLHTDESPQMIRAKAVYALRRLCEAAGAAVCSVRLADDSLQSTAPAVRASGPMRAGVTGAGAGGEYKVTLSDLGVQKSRAIITGSFQKDEVVTLAQRLNSDPTARWRINGITVRGTSFEVDVERHMIAPNATGDGR